MTRAFLLMNLEQRGGHHHGPLKFKIPIGLLGESIAELGSFPYSPGERTFDGPTLFIKGTRSKCVMTLHVYLPFSILRPSYRYINRHNVDLAKAFFPNMIMKELDTNHWGESIVFDVWPY